MSRDKTLAIIGAGVAGLAAGSYLAKLGYKVKVFEAQDYIGGCCSTTTIGGYTFNNGAMTVILPGLLDFVFARLGVELTSMLELKRITAPQRSFLGNGVTVTLGDKMEVTLEGIKDTGQAARDLDYMVKKWEPLYQVFRDLPTRPFSIGSWVSKAWRHLPRVVGTVGSELNSLIKDENLRAALIGHLGYSGVDPGKLPAPGILALVVMLKEGYYIPEGGMGSIPKVLAKTLTNQGGEIVLGAKVEQITITNGCVAGLNVAGHGFYEAKAVISTASGMLTYGKLIDLSPKLGSHKRKALNKPLSLKPFYVQLGTTNRINIDSHLNYILPAPAEVRKYFAPEGSEVRWGFFAVPTTFMPGLTPNGGSIIELSPAVRIDESFADWNEEKAEKLADATLSLLSGTYKLDIAVKRVRTPKTLEKEMHLYQGAIYGLSPTVGPLGLFKHKTPVSGLYLAGQTTYPGFGVTPSAVSGILAVEELLKNEPLK